jgi:1-acyl-sn-glycerol-3-phosphate acyltransferase
MKALRAIHTVYGFIIFIVLFLLLLPFFLIPIAFPSQFRLVGIFNRWWARLFFIFAFLPMEVVGRERLNSKRQYVFSPNHFSYLDIPLMGLNPVNTIFVGKSEIGKVPLFGWMYSRLHITVNRASLKSKMNSLKQSLEAVDQGKSLVIFAEGGMIAKHPPQMSRFKDGAFRVAIEKQIPIVPVTIPHNWIILPDPENRLYGGKVKVIFHEPIETLGMTVAQTDELKERVFAIIDKELKNENR